MLETTQIRKFTWKTSQGVLQFDSSSNITSLYQGDFEKPDESKSLQDLLQFSTKLAASLTIY